MHLFFPDGNALEYITRSPDFLNRAEIMIGDVFSILVSYMCFIWLTHVILMIWFSCRWGKWSTERASNLLKNHTVIKLQTQHLNPDSHGLRARGLKYHTIYSVWIWIRWSAESQCLHSEGQISYHSESLKVSLFGSAFLPHRPQNKI